jgi:uncharacterized protein
MLIEFAITNFRSFQSRQVFSLLPSAKVKQRYNPLLATEKYPKIQVPPSAVIYGANNAGKSNFLGAIKALEWLVCNSASFNSNQKLVANEFFIFNTKTKEQPTTFEIDFIAPNKKRYNYQICFNTTQVLEEALYVYNISETGKMSASTLFERTKQEIKFPALKGVRKEVRFQENQLFLSRGDVEGNEELRQVYAFFAHHLSILKLTETEYTDFLTRSYANFAANNPENPILKTIEIILKETDTGILGIETNLIDKDKIGFGEDVPQAIKDKIFEQLKYEIRTKHRLFDGDTEIGTESIALQEQSTGTRKLLGLTPIILTALEDGDVLFIDEMNTSMHTHITSFLITLFNDKTTNPNGAQLIITTHDIQIIRDDIFDKDQIFMVEKSAAGASELSSFANITGLRNEARLDEFYATGRLGGTPTIATPYLQHVISKFLADAKTKS